mgnify:CR=1 FL=1
MNSHEEAQDMVNYYDQHPAALYGKPITFYLSRRLMVIEVTIRFMIHQNVPQPQTLTVLYLTLRKKVGRRTR